MSLGGKFPPALAQASISRRLTSGAVIKFASLMDDGKIKEKRWVVVHVDGDVVALVVNTRIHPFIQANNSLNICQVLMSASDHPFMDHDSWVDCSRARVHSKAGVVQQLVEHPKYMLGTIVDTLRDQIIAGLKRSILMPPADVALFCATLEAASL